MASVKANLSMPWGAGVLINISNHSSAGSPGVTRSPETPCTTCCCGLLNHTLTVVFMASLAFAIVVGNVVTLTVFIQTRQSRTPQGYLKGTHQHLYSLTAKEVAVQQRSKRGQCQYWGFFLAFCYVDMVCAYK